MRLIKLVLILFLIMTTSCSKKKNTLGLKDISFVTSDISKVVDGVFYKNKFYFISKMRDHYIQIFDKEFNYIKSFGNFGDGPSELAQPADILIENDLLYILDKSKNKISTFNIDGTFVHSIKLEDINQPNSFSKREDKFLVTSFKFGDGNIVDVYDFDGNKIDSIIKQTEAESPFKQAMLNFSAVYSNNDEIYLFKFKDRIFNMISKDLKNVEKKELVFLPFNIDQNINPQNAGKFSVQDMEFNGTETFLLVGGGMSDAIEAQTLYIHNTKNAKRYYKIDDSILKKMELGKNDFIGCSIFSDDHFLYVCGFNWDSILKIDLSYFY